MKLLLHIGTEKTGTTTLQSWAHKNAAKLKASGIGYPSSLGRPNNRKISVFARDPSKPDDGFIRFAIKSPEDHAKFSQELKKEFRAEVERLREEKCHTILISNEHMHSRLNTVEMVSRLPELFDDMFDEVEVICYVRPQAELLQSWLSVAARIGGLRREPMEIDGRLSYYDYLSLYRRWRAVFDTVKLLPFKRTKDIIASFCGHLGIEKLDFEDVGRTNEKLDYRAAAISYNLSMNKFAGGAVNRNSSFFIDEMPVDEPISISREQAEFMNRKFKISNETLSDICRTVVYDDLVADLQKFPEKGNIDDALQIWPASEFLQFAIVRLNVQLWLERVNTKLAEAERAILRRNYKNAEWFLDKGEEFLGFAAQANLDSVRDRVAAKRHQLKKLRHLVPATDNKP